MPMRASELIKLLSMLPEDDEVFIQAWSGEVTPIKQCKSDTWLNCTDKYLQDFVDIPDTSFIVLVQDSPDA